MGLQKETVIPTLGKNLFRGVAPSYYDETRGQLFSPIFCVDIRFQKSYHHENYRKLIPV